MFDAPDEPETTSVYECLNCGSIERANSHPGDCSDCGSVMQSRAKSLE